jgi:catalase
LTHSTRPTPGPIEEDLLFLQPVGRMVLNRNMDNFFTENEQLAFCPGPASSCRASPTPDTQRHRLHGSKLPAAPGQRAQKCAHHNNHYDGFINFMHRDEEVDYFPSRYDPAKNAPKVPDLPSDSHQRRREKMVIKKENDFKQPGRVEVPLHASMDPARCARLYN